MYQPRRSSRSEFLDIRGLQYHVRVWDHPEIQPSVSWVFLHGWMDIAASFQFVVDHLPDDWRIIAPDWRGYGRTARPAADCYWFPDYLGDLEALLDRYLPEEKANLAGHSMGGNVAALYAGIRPDRIERLVNLEGLGLQATDPGQAPGRYAQWLDELRSNTPFRPYASRDAVIERLQKNNPRLRSDFAQYVAGFWAAPGIEGLYHLLGDPAHKVVNPYLYNADEVTACWAAIEAPALWVISEHLGARRAFVDSPEYQARLARIARLERATILDAGHMMHHDQPEQVAAVIRAFAQRT